MLVLMDYSKIGIMLVLLRTVLIELIAYLVLKWVELLTYTTLLICAVMVLVKLKVNHSLLLTFVLPMVTQE